MPLPRRTKGFAQVTPNLGAHVPREVLLALLEEGEARVTGTSFSGLELRDVSTGGAAFENVAFHGCAFERVDFSRGTLTDVLFSGCRFVGCSFARSWLNRVDFRSCSAPGLSFSKSRLTGVLAEDGQFGYADLAEATANRLRVVSTGLAEANVFSARLSHVELDRCDLSRATVARTSLSGIDLSTCDISGIRVSSDVRELRGALVSASQAAGLARLLGIVVKEDEWL